MDPELQQYLNAVVLLLSLVVGFQATRLLVSGVSVSIGFFLVPLVAAAVVWFGVATLTGIGR